MFTPATKVGGNGEMETIHQMRVNSRRLRVGLDFFSALFAEGELNQIQRQLRRLTNTLGQVRALDVDRELLHAICKQSDITPTATARVRQSLLLERRARLAVLRQLIGVFEVSKFEQRVCALIATTRHEDKAVWVTRHCNERLNDLRRVLRRRFKQYRKKETSKAFHKLRIAAKKYRYGLEASDSVFRAERKSQIRAVERVQDLMGAAHDVEVLLDFVKQVRSDQNGSSEQTHDGLGRLARTLKREHKTRMTVFDRHIRKQRRWMKKVKLKAP